jgi:hypothetical protein
MAKLGDYLTKNKIDPRRVLAASKNLEALRPEDRKLREAKAKAKGGDEAAKAAVADKPKPRSGHRVTRPSLDRALAGKPVSGPTKTRIARAVSAILEQKKKPAASVADLF